MDSLLCSRCKNTLYVIRYSFALSFLILKLLLILACMIETGTCDPSLTIVELIGILALFLTLVVMLLVVFCIFSMLCKGVPIRAF